MSSDSRTRWSLLAAYLLATVPRTARAAEPVEPTLTLADAVARALEHNPQLAATVADVRIAAAHVLEAEGAEDLVVGASGTWSVLRGPDVPGAVLDDALVAVSLARLLPTGGVLRLQLGGEYTRTASRAGAAEVYQPAAVLSLTHPLLRGFGVEVTRAERSRARIALEESSLEREAEAADLVRAVVQTYWELAFATTELRVRRSSLHQAREQLRAVNASIDVGKQPPSAAAEVEVVTALREDEVFQAERLARQRSLELQQLLGVEAADPTLLAADPLEPRFAPRELGTALDEARRHNPLLAAARARGAAAAVDVDVTRNGLLPQLDFTIAGGPLGIGSTPRGALDDLRRPGGYTVLAGLTFSAPIEGHAALGRHAAASEGLRKATLSADAISIRVVAGVTKATDAIAVAERRVGVLARATGLAELDLQAETARFQAGRSSSFEVLRRQDGLARAQLLLARARADYLEGEALLDSLTAEILPRFGVELR